MFNIVININCRHLLCMAARQGSIRYVLYEIADNDITDCI